MTETLALVRDETLTVAFLAALFGESETWIAGLIDAVDGGTDWRELFADSDVEPGAAEKADYADGFAFGLAVLEGREQAAPEGSSECYAMAGEPVDASDIPW